MFMYETVTAPIMEEEESSRRVENSITLGPRPIPLSGEMIVKFGLYLFYCLPISIALEQMQDINDKIN